MAFSLDLPEAFPKPVQAASIERVGKIIRDHREVVGTLPFGPARRAVTLPSMSIVNCSVA